MRALILAAGLGTRLAPITDNIPKSLVPVNGKPILFKQIENLRENKIDDITIVSGYKADVLEKAIHDNWPDIKIVESVDYATTNNMYSAYLGIKAMFSEHENDASSPKRKNSKNDKIGESYENGENSEICGVVTEPFLMMNADVFYDASVIKALLQNSEHNLIVVDLGRYIEESMKIIEENGRITSISKQITPEKALGCSIDVYKFGVDGGQAFFNHCVDYIEDRGELKLWSEVALNDALSDVVFHACPLNGRWLEIDNHEDLAAAEKLFADEV